MFNVNWANLVLFLTPPFLRRTKRIAWLEILVSQIKALHTQFLTYRSDAIYKVRYNSQIIYLTKLLNDKWDNINRGIYIDNVANVNRLFIYNKAESRPKTYLYNKWNNATAYLVGEYAVHGDKVFVCIANSTGNTPSSSPAHWQFHSNRLILKNKSEYQTQVDFIVMVPVAVVFDINEMKALVSFYKLADKRFTIQTY